MRYIRQLDSLRAIAVLFVLIQHYIPEKFLINKLPNAIIGVSLFFVLSGFLITSILFHQLREAQVGKLILVKNFYARRTLRIFPIYYLTVVLLMIFAASTDTKIATTYGYFLTYTSNIHFFQHGWDGMLSHLWTLAVEEQFYLIWPWLILFVPQKYLPHLILSFIGVGILTQLLLVDVKMGDIVTFTCFDAFGLGAFLAWVYVYKNNRLQTFYKVASVVAAISFVYFLTTTFWGIYFVPTRTIISLISVWLIAYVLLHEGNLRFKFILNNRVLLFLGKISYGLYLFQNIIPKMLNINVIDRYINPHLPGFITAHWAELFLLENLLLLIGISWLSYEFIEKRFLGLKKYFENVPKQTLPNVVKPGGTISTIKAENKSIPN